MCFQMEQLYYTEQQFTEKLRKQFSLITGGFLRFHNRMIKSSAFFAQLVSELRLCVVNAASSESMWWRFSTDHRIGFTDEMYMTIMQP